MQGIIPPLVTPLDHAGRVCEVSVKNLIGSLGGGFAALMPVLSSGEGRFVDKSQWRDMVSYAIKYGGGKPVYPGVVRQTTAEVINLGKQATKLGVAGITVTTPFGTEISQAEIYDHFVAIAREIDLPIFLYNEELISGNTIEVETFIKLFETLPICGVKESSGDIAVFDAITTVAGEIPVFQGWENLALASKQGAGYIFPLANLDCRLCVETYLRTSDGDLQAQINDLCASYGLFEKDWFKRIKIELHRRGIITTAQSVEVEESYA